MAQHLQGQTISLAGLFNYLDLRKFGLKRCVLSLSTGNTGCSLNIVFFPSFLPVLLQRWCSTCLVCVHTLTPRERQEFGIF